MSERGCNERTTSDGQPVRVQGQISQKRLDEMAALVKGYVDSRCGVDSDKPMRFGGMIICPDCGNKRCPKASHHDNACTGSNEPGQEGSVYA